MAGRPTVADLAREAGVSVATVDRVLNARLPVRPETAQRVFAAAEAIGYHGAGLIRRRVEEARPRYRLGFLLQRPDQVFYQQFKHELLAASAAATAFRVEPNLRFLSSQTPGDIVTNLEAMAERNQAVAMVSVDHPSVSTAVAALEARGIPVFSLLSDFAPGIRRGYVGLDNLKAGRTSGWLLARCAPGPGKVAIFVGSHRFHGHEMREIGFRSYLREAAPHLELIDTQASLEDVAVAHEAVLDLIRRYPDLSGIYVAGGGTEGVIDAIREEGMAGRIAAVGNELTEITRAALAENLLSAVVVTPLQQLSQQLIGVMAAAIDSPGAEAGGQVFLPFYIHVSENI